MKRTSVTATTALVVLACLLLGADETDEEKKVPFLFTEDQKVAAVEDPLMTIAPSDALHSDPYLSGPMTRLEYMLTRIDEQLKDNAWLDMEMIREAFEAYSSTLEPSISAYARYVESIGKVVVTWDVEYVGAPKQPIRKTCDEMLDYLTSAFPQELLGWTYHNTVLGVLWQNDSKYYTPVLYKLSKNIVYRVAITSITTGDSEHHYQMFSCVKETKDAPIVYGKSSTRFGRTQPQPPSN